MKKKYHSLVAPVDFARCLLLELLQLILRRKKRNHRDEPMRRVSLPLTQNLKSGIFTSLPEKFQTMLFLIFSKLKQKGKDIVQYNERVFFFSSSIEQFHVLWLCFQFTHSAPSKAYQRQRSSWHLAADVNQLQNHFAKSHEHPIAILLKTHREHTHTHTTYDQCFVCCFPRRKGEHFQQQLLISFLSMKLILCKHFADDRKVKPG